MRIVDLSKKTPQQRITVLSYGAMRSGKTRFSASFPRPLFLSDNTETGWTTIENMDPSWFYEPGRYPDCWAIERAEDMSQAITNLGQIVTTQPGKYLTVVVDSLTFYNDLFFSAIDSAARSGGRTPDNRLLYGQLAAHLRDVRIRVHSLPLNVVWLCLEKPPGEDAPFGMPMLSGQSAQKFAAGVDYLLFHRTYQANPKDGPQWEVHTRQWGAYKAGGRDEGLLPDVLPTASYLAMAEALSLPAPPLGPVNGTAASQTTPAPGPAPQRRIISPGQTVRSR